MSGATSSSILTPSTLIALLFIYIFLRTIEFGVRYWRTEYSSSSSSKSSAECASDHSTPRILLVLGGEEEREYAGVELVRRALGRPEKKQTKDLTSSIPTTPSFRFHSDSQKQLAQIKPTFLIVSSGHFQADHHAFDVLRDNADGVEKGIMTRNTSSQQQHHPYFVDHRAIDTVTNYTTLAHDLISTASSPSSVIPSTLLPTRSLYILTSHYHLPRALSVGRIILTAGFGIRLIPVTIEDPASAREEKPSSNKVAAVLGGGSIKKQLSTVESESGMRIARDVFRALCWLYFRVDGVSLSRMVHPRRWRRSERQQKEEEAKQQ